MVTLKAPTIDQIWDWLEEVPDPEIPVISVVDLGVIRDVLVDGSSVEVIITPTYTGCPAMSVISFDIEKALAKKGVTELTLKTKIAPPWTTDWLSEKGRARLEEFGIAPPLKSGSPERCPQCKSSSVELVSQFGSTPCKAQWRCRDCFEPFDYFKCI
ncbi:MAG: phenylacetate-CoA oxygenase subunit PaaJ [Rhodobacteraceae bacterium]|nr:phenylacetate-CoA oxygenase subunit PaaJ [Paracoccaceae bacterium]